MIKVKCGFVVLALIAWIVGGPGLVFASSPEVKLSSSSICHDRESPWYDRTQRYTSFSDLESCLAAGGRLPKGAALTLSHEDSTYTAAAIPRYDRRYFGAGWSDVDGDCQDSRAEALVETSTTPVQFASGKRCRVVRGRWVSPFTGRVIQNAGDIDIDHVVPLSWAWRRGAWQWSDEAREQFANDRVNLWPVESSLNRSKSDQPPSEWLPPSGQCQYVARFARVSKVYGLKPTVSEASFLKQFLGRCQANNH